ncbi:hypothetical protein MN116_008649 [Schistosoma mekongi]|uniref:PH domain-containing protein n=1 Tax=Schistosoma mekongi TaxID=38744 RepID=A0AAE1Z6E9_SCHME|nr:hypothetical protein MN116_008649 [Schistosoma mekongi]
MNDKLMYDSESAPGGPSRRQLPQYLHKLTSYSFDLDHLHKMKMAQQQCDLVASLERVKFSQQYDNHYHPQHYFSGQSELKHNYSDSDEPSGFYQPIQLNQHYHSSHRQFRAFDRLPKHKHIENSFHQKLPDSNLFMLHTDQHHQLKAPIVTTHGILMTDNAISSEASPIQMPSSTSFPLTISRETAFKPINHKFTDRNASSSTQSIHEYKSESNVVNNADNQVGYSISSNSRNDAKINSTPNLLDYINKMNPSENGLNYSNPLVYKQQLLKQQLQPFKQFQQDEKSYHDDRLTTFKRECTTSSMEELLKRQQKLDHLQYCLQRYEIEREEAGQAIRRIEERMQELEARASDLLEYDISNSLTNDTINLSQQQQQQRQLGIIDPSINKLCSQSHQLTTEDLESRYINWLKSIENSTHTLKSIESDRNLASIYAQNNYMYIESSTNNENDTSTYQPKSLCTLKHSFDPVTTSNVSNTPSSKTTTSVDNIYNSQSNSSQQETKRNLLLEHLMVQRQRLATADASVALLAKRLMLLNTSPKVQQDSTLEKTFYKQKVSYPGTPLEQTISTCDERVEKSLLYNQHAFPNAMIYNVLRNSNLISNKVNSIAVSEYSTDSKYQSQFQRSFEDDILTHRHSPRQKITGWRKSSTIERTNSSSVQYLLDSSRNNNSNNITRSTNATRKFNDNSTNYFKDNSNNELSNLQQSGDLSIAGTDRQRLPTPISSGLPVRNVKPYSYKTQPPTKYASENGYIELANASSSPTNDDDYTSRLLYGISKTQLPSRRFLNTNTLNISRTGFLTPMNCSSSSSSIATTQPLLCKESLLMKKSPLHHRLTPSSQHQYQSQIQQPKVAPPLPPKPNLFHPQISMQETGQTQEHLSAEDEEVYKFMSRSLDTNDETNLDFQSLDRNLTDSKQRPLPPPYYVNINNTNEEKLLTQRKIFSHKTLKIVNNNNKTNKLIKETIPLNYESKVYTESLTSLTNELTKEDDGSNSHLLNSSSKSRKSFSSIEKMKNQPEVNQTHKSKRYIKQKSDYAFNLRDYLQTLHHPINELSIKTSDTTLLPEQQGGICLTSLLGNWLTSRSSRAQKSSLIDQSMDYFQCKIILTSRICGGYLWIMKKPSRHRSNNNSISNNIWDSILRRVHDTTFNQSINNTENEKHNKRIIIRSSNNPRWYRKWLSCDMLEQKIFICERKECGRIESTINFATITDIHQSSTDQLLDCHKSCSLSPRSSQKTSSTLLNTNNKNINEIKSTTYEDNSSEEPKHSLFTKIKTTTLDNTTTTSKKNCTEKIETFFCLETTLHTYFLMAPSTELTRLWMDVLKQAMRMVSNSTSLNND